MATNKLIQTITVGAGGAASIEFTSIPQTYTDLVLKYSLRGTSQVDTWLKFNSSTSTYTNKLLIGDGSAVSSYSNVTNATYGSFTSNATPVTTSNVFCNAEIYIPNYAGSTNKSFSVDSVTEANATTAYANFTAGLLNQTAAISSITIVIGTAQTIQQYSTASLYGILKGSGGATVS